MSGQMASSKRSWASFWLSPVILFGFVPIVVAAFAWAPTFTPALTAVFLTWGLLASVLLTATSAYLPPQNFVPNSSLTSEASKLGGLVRGGLGVFVAAVVGAFGAAAVEQDLANGAAGLSGVFSLLGIVSIAIAFVLFARLFFGLAFRWHIAPELGRRAAVRRLLFTILMLARGKRRARRAAGSELFRAWVVDLSGRGPAWASAGLGTLASSMAIGWATVTIPAWIAG